MRQHSSKSRSATVLLLKHFTSSHQHTSTKRGHHLRRVDGRGCVVLQLRGTNSLLNGVAGSEMSLVKPIVPGLEASTKQLSLDGL